MSLKKDIIGAEVQIGSSEAQKSLVDLTQKTSTLANENDRLRITQAKLKALGKSHEEEYKKITKTIADNSKSIKENNAQMDALRKTIGLTEMSQTQLKKRSLELRRELNGMTESADPTRFAKLNDELVATEKQFNKNKAAIGATSGFLGKLESSLSSIPGPVGAVIQSITGVGKALWTLVANPIGATIAVIVGGLMLLYKAFTSTDSGAVAMAGTFKVIGNVLDIMIDRTMSFYKMLGSIVTLDWQGFKKNGTEAFGGLGKSIKDVANAGWNYAKIMDDVADREAAAQPRMSKLRAEIEKLKNTSKDANKTAKEKSDLIDQAMGKEIELNSIEKGFLKERTAAEVSNLASKINNGKLTMAQKEAQLKQWLDIDDKQLASAMEKDKAFAEFENKNEEAFQALQKMKAEEFDKDAEFEKETRRLQKASSSEKQAIIAEEIAARKDASDKAIQQLDAANNQRLSKLTDQYIKEGWSEEKFQSEQLAAEQAYLVMKKALLEQYGQSTIDVDNQINQRRIEAQKTANDTFAKTMADFTKENEAAQAEDQKSEDAAIAALIERTNVAVDAMKAAEEKEKDIIKQRQAQYLQFAQSAGQTFADLMNDNEATMADYLKATLVMALDAFHEFFMIEKAKAIIAGMGKGPVGIAIAIAKVVAMEVAYQAVRGALTSKKSGSKQSGGFAETAASDSTPMGTYHANEFIGSAPSARNPSIRQVYNIIDLAQKQGRVATLNLPAVMASMGMLPNGRQSGGFASSSHPELVSGSNPIMQSSRDPALTSAINRLNSNLEKGIKASINKYGTNGVEEALADIADFKSKVFKP